MSHDDACDVAGRPRIVVTGVGARTPFGDAAATWVRVLAGDRAARDWDDLAAEGHRAIRACRIDAPALDESGREVADTRRGRALAVAAAADALRDAGLTEPVDRAAGIFVGSTLGESAAWERAGAGEPVDLADHGVASFGAGVARAFALTGPRAALATACAAGNHAIGAAALALRRGRVPWALAGGVEPFSRLSLVGFARSRAMASGDCLPFDVRRTGMLLGEGAAMLVLERLADARARGARPLAEVRGLGLASDAHHPTAPRPDGRGMEGAMRLALAEAGLAPADVDWVNLHGTGTRVSDAAEARALRAVFDGVPMPLLSGSKGALGHALGAASAIEAVLTVRGLGEGVVPPTAGHDVEDPDIGVACTREARRPARRPLRVAISNAFAFGGINTSLVLAAAGGA